MRRDASITPKAKRFVRDTMMFGRFKRLFFVGIGGAGMSGIAEILKNLGYEISGSDTTPSEVTDYLQSIGIKVAAEHRAANISDIDVVVISSAVGENNPEVVEARRLGIPVIKRAEMLGELMRLKFSVGVAGTHGKTTTTSMIGKILRQASLHPTLIVGGVVAELGTGASLGEGDYLVAEVDEYDRSIFAMFPSMAVVLNIEADHLDCYSDMDDLRGAFLSYINRVPFYGSAIISADDPNLSSLRGRITRPFATFGFATDADYRAVEIKQEPGRTTFSVYCRGDLLGEIILRVPGRHNVANALAATAAARELDVSFENIADALRQFNGVGRRFELIGTAHGVTVIDDYAHHPTEIAATLDTARTNFSGRIIAVFQPHLFSRTKHFLREFADVLSRADHCILTDIYPARELPMPGVTSDSIREEALRQGHRNFTYVGKKENAIDEVVGMARPGDTIVIIGAGSITHIRKPVLERITSQS
ncbi:MAG: UDP-N-acetylmuramate--L-alanine ligase [candidate division Zixibacteria bacterium]|nr:UDP-N-acetylmuramate--L-alanine ligase [candidate division Zixibacteria bacterium]